LFKRESHFGLELDALVLTKNDKYVNNITLLKDLLKLIKKSKGRLIGYEGW